MRRPSPIAAQAYAPRGAFAPAPTWAYDTRGTAAATVLVWTQLLLLILPPNLNYGALLITQGTTSDQQQTITSKVIVIGLFVCSCILIARRSKLWAAVVRSLNPFYTLLIALAAVSVVWSTDPSLTMPHVFRLMVALLCFTAFTLTGWRNDRFQTVVRSLLGVFLVGSLIFAVLFPHYGVQQFLDYAAVLHSSIVPKSYSLSPDVRAVLRGLTFGKNQMGQLASLGVVFWFHAWLGKESKTLMVAICGAAALICLYWSHSSTSLIAAVFAVPFMLMLRHWPRWLRRYMPYILTAFTLLILGYSLVVLKLIPQLDFLLTPITAITGKDLTFSSRTLIWQVINAHIAQHPILGTGYSAYWSDKLDSPSQEMQRILFFNPGEAHNGYLDVINDLGLIGGLCLLGYLFSFLRQSLKIMTFDRHQGSLYLTLLFHQIFSSLSESHWFGFASAPFMIMSLATCTTARTLLQHRFELKAARSPAI
jgi:exopolysaccharide production protein ExoQ